MHTIFKFNRLIVTHTSKYNLAEGLDFKKPRNDVCCENLNENVKR